MANRATAAATVREIRPGAAAEPAAERVDVAEQLLYVDPQLLTLGPNARIDAKLDPEFLASIAELGVLQPIICYRNDHDELVVLLGQRRALAAIRAELATVPIVLSATPPGDVDRLFDQLAENDHRAALGTGERVDAVQQLAAFGVPAAAIALKGAYRRDDVDAALAVAASPLAVEAAQQHPGLDLIGAAAVAEFADSPAVVEEITAAADRGASVDHVVQHARDARRDEQDRADAIAALRGRGELVLDDPRQPAGSRQLGALDLTPAQHRNCPGHAAVMRQDFAAPVDGHHAAAWVPLWLCLDPVKHGHAGQPVQTDLDAEAAAQERARITAGNREWRSAETVRRRWLTELGARKTPPPGAQQFILSALLSCDRSIWLAMERSSLHQTGRDLLGLDREAHDSPLAADSAREELAGLLTRAPGYTPGRATVLTLLLVLAAWEERTGPTTWQRPTDQDRRYLAAMIAMGYEPAPIERRLVDATAAS